MTQSLSDDTLVLPCSSPVSCAASKRLPYRPPFLTTLAANSNTAGKSVTAAERHYGSAMTGLS